jgi:Mu-like prophage I protein
MNGIAELFRLRLAETIAAGDTTPMMVFPIGEWHSTLYPDLALTEDLANEMIANFEAGILGTEPVVDSSGKHDTSVPAAGWVKRVYLASYEEGDVTGLALWADVKWTGIGATMLSDDQYKYGSVEIGPVTVNGSGEKVENVLRSLTLTNTPVLRLMPGVRDAQAKQRSVVTLSLSEVTLAAIPEFIKAKMRAKWLKANPGKTEDDVPENMKASEGLTGLAETDPVATAVAALEDALTAANDALGGKLGIPVIRTYLREAIRKASAHALTEDPGDHAEPIDGSSDDVSQLAKVDEGQDVVLADGDAATKGSDPMKTVATKLNLAEDAPEALVLAEVVKLAEHDAAETKRADTAETTLAEVEKAKRDAEIEATLTELVDGGHVLPGQKEAWTKLAEDSPESFAVFAVNAKKVKAIELGEIGTSAGSESSTDDPTVELDNRAKKLAEERSIPYGDAMSLALAEDPALAGRYNAREL